MADSEALKCVMWHADFCDEQQPPIYSGHGQNMQRKDEGWRVGSLVSSHAEREVKETFVCEAYSDEKWHLNTTEL